MPRCLVPSKTLKGSKGGVTSEEEGHDAEPRDWWHEVSRRVRTRCRLWWNSRRGRASSPTSASRLRNASCWLHGELRSQAEQRHRRACLGVDGVTGVFPRQAVAFSQQVDAFDSNKFGQACERVRLLRPRREACCDQERWQSGERRSEAQWRAWWSPFRGGRTRRLACGAPPRVLATSDDAETARLRKTRISTIACTSVWTETRCRRESTSRCVWARSRCWNAGYRCGLDPENVRSRCRDGSTPQAWIQRLRARLVERRRRHRCYRWKWVTSVRKDTTSNAPRCGATSAMARCQHEARHELMTSAKELSYETVRPLIFVLEENIWHANERPLLLRHVALCLLTPSSDTRVKGSVLSSFFFLLLLSSFFFLLPSSFFLLPSSFFLLPSSFFLLSSFFFLLSSFFFLLSSFFFLLSSFFFLLSSFFLLLSSSLTQNRALQNKICAGKSDVSGGGPEREN